MSTSRDASYSHAVQRRVRVAFAVVFVALLGVSASEGENTRGNDAEDENPIVHRLDLLSMMEGIGMGTGASRRIIDVGLDWKYMSATAEDKITTPKLLVGAATASDA